MNAEERDRRKKLKVEAKLIMANQATMRSKISVTTTPHNTTPFLGQTKKSVFICFGKAAKTDVIVMKTKSREVLKYFPIGVNRYKLKIILDDGAVSSWEIKG